MPGGNRGVEGTLRAGGWFICILRNIILPAPLLQTQHVPTIWEDAVVVPVPKSNCPKTVGDFRPVALTSVLMKTFEKLVRSETLRQTEHTLDPVQFAYTPHRGVKDATLTLLNVVF